MTTTHSAMTGAELHEPKGVDTAAADQYYVSNGAGSGVWTNIPQAQKSKYALSGKFEVRPFSGMDDGLIVPLAGNITVISGHFLDNNVLTPSIDVYINGGINTSLQILASEVDASGEYFKTHLINNSVVAGDRIQVYAAANYGGESNIRLTFFIEEA